MKNVDTLKLALITVIGFSSSLVGFASYLILDRVEANEAAIAPGILPVAAEREIENRRRIERLERKQDDLQRRVGKLE